MLLEGGSCRTQPFRNTEEGFHTNICTSTNRYYVINTLAQLIDWAFLLMIENRFAEDNQLIAIIN